MSKYEWHVNLKFKTTMKKFKWFPPVSKVIIFKTGQQPSIYSLTRKYF